MKRYAMGGKILNIGIGIQHCAVRLRNLLSQHTHLCEPQSIYLKRGHYETAVTDSPQRFKLSLLPAGSAVVLQLLISQRR